MKILWVIGSLNTSYGGIVAAIKQFSNSLQTIGHYSEIVTLDKKGDLNESGVSNVVYNLGPSFGKYRFNIHLIKWLIRNVKDYDIVIVNGIWQFHSFAVWIASKIVKFPYIVFPHGMLDPWFKHNYPIKHLKKWLYWPWSEYWVLRDAKAVFFTTEEERNLASQSFWLYKVNDYVVPLGISSPIFDTNLLRQKFYSKFPFLRNKVKVLFMSRIHPKKGCDLLINAFSQILDNNHLHLIIAGPDHDGWKKDLVEQSKKLGIYEHITWTGMLEGDLKWGAFYSSDVFILPSHSENFGVVVVEALACSLPVLITNKINIWREIDAENAGYVSSDTLEGVVELLRKWSRLNEYENMIMKKNSHECFLKFFEINNASVRLIETINFILNN